MQRIECTRRGVGAIVCAAMFMFAPLAHAAVMTITAGAAGNAADATGDGLGDAGAAATSFYMSAGVNSAGPPEATGTVRMQFEFDISGLGTGPVTSAQVQLTTETVAFAPIDTTFFATTVDGNGTIEAADFQAPAAAIAGAVMPPATSGTFDFDVTSEVNAALAAGHHWLVVQGRVDESLGPSYQRGLQVETNASFIPAGERPRLVVTSDAVAPPPPAAPSLPVPAVGNAALALLALVLGGLGFAALRRRA